MRVDIRVVVAAVAVNLLCVLPPFLTGVMGVQIGRDFGIPAASVGILVSAFAMGSIIASAPLGRRVGQWGIRNCLRITAIIAGTGLVVAALSQTPWSLALAMFLAGLANGLGQPAANALIAAQLPAHRHGIAYAIKQSGVPLSTFLAGLAVPLIALTIGWRWAYALALGLAALAFVLAPVDWSVVPGRVEAAVAPALRRTLWIFAAGMALAVAAATSIGAIGTAGGVAAGLSEKSAGYLVAVGGLTALAVRLVVGLWADRRPFNELAGAAILLGIGVIGWLSMSTAIPVLFAIGLIVANSFGWGWPGLANLTLARRFTDATAAASGVVQTGVSLGVLVGPLVLGLLATSQGWVITWVTAATSGLLGALVLLWVSRQLAGPAPDNAVDAVQHPAPRRAA